jgi:hypothetical protein
VHEEKADLKAPVAHEGRKHIDVFTVESATSERAREGETMLVSPAHRLL